jgi:hypothetical protein
MEGISQEVLQKNYRLTKIIGFMMIATLFVYLIVVEYIKWENAPFEGFSPFPEISILRYVFIGVAIIEFFLIGYIEKRALSERNPSKNNQTRAVSSLCPPEIQPLMSAGIIVFAMCEFIAIYGLTLFLLAGNSLDFYTFMVISLLAFWKYFPRYSHWEEWVKKNTW